MKFLKPVYQYAMLIIVAPCLLLIGCDKDGSHKLKGCCDEPAINTTVGNGHLYMPNVFTPNADGINDILWVSADYNIVFIRSFQVRDKEGRTVFQVLDGIPNDYSSGWNGMVNNKYENGIYSVRMQVEASDGTIATLEGKVCNFRCLDNGAEDPISVDGCQFPVQVTDGHFDSLIPNGEQAICFE
jgi:hypothetical protein